MHKSERGFTIIETMIVIAIGGMLLAVAISAITSTINSTRFADAMRSTESYMQQQYSEVSSGRNIYQGLGRCAVGASNEPVVSNGPTEVVPGRTNCTILGRLLTFGEGGQIISRYILGGDRSAIAGGSPTAKLNSLRPLALNVDQVNANFDSPWSTGFGSIRNAAGSPVDSVAIIKSPDTGKMMIYNLSVPNEDDNVNLMFSANNLNQAVNVCVETSGTLARRSGYIRVAAGQGQDVIKMDLEAGSCQ